MSFSFTVAAQSTDTSLVVTPTVINDSISGMGWNHSDAESLGFWPPDATGKDFTDDDWTRFYDLLSWTNVSSIRYMFVQQSYENQRDIYSFDSDAMKRHYRQLDEIAKRGIPVLLSDFYCSGDWLCPKDDYTVFNAQTAREDWGNSVTELLRELKVVRGYNNINALSIWNEPIYNQGFYPNPFWQLYPAVIDKLNAAKLRDSIRLIGPDGTCGNGPDGVGESCLQLNSQLDQYGNILDGFADHAYVYNRDYIAAVDNYTPVIRSLRTTRYNSNVSFDITEYGSPTCSNDDNFVYNNSVALAGKLIARGFNYGISGFYRWQFREVNDTGGRCKDLSAIDYSDTAFFFKPYGPVYYPHSVQSRYLYAGWKVLTTSIPDSDNGVFTSVLRSQDNSATTVLLTNEQGDARTVNLDLSAIPNVPGSLNVVEVTGPDSGMIAADPVALNNGVGSIVVPPHSIVTLTTLDLGDLGTPAQLSLPR